VFRKVLTAICQRRTWKRKENKGGSQGAGGQRLVGKYPYVQDTKDLQIKKKGHCMKKKHNSK